MITFSVANIKISKIDDSIPQTEILNGIHLHLTHGKLGNGSQ